MHLDFRQAVDSDIPALMRIRNNVRENPLTSLVLTTQDYRQAMFHDGCAWVCEVDGEIAGFSTARKVQGDIWALFVDEAYERRGVGSGLMDRAEAWCFEQGLELVRLNTAPGTKAERLYRKRGWRAVGTSPHDEIVFELRPGQKID